MTNNLKGNKTQKLDLLLITPSSDYKKHQKEILGRRIEKDIGVQNAPAPGIG